MEIGEWKKAKDLQDYYEGQRACFGDMFFFENVRDCYG